MVGGCKEEPQDLKHLIKHYYFHIKIIEQINDSNLAPLSCFFKEYNTQCRKLTSFQSHISNYHSNDRSIDNLKEEFVKYDESEEIYNDQMDDFVIDDSGEIIDDSNNENHSLKK